MTFPGSLPVQMLGRPALHSRTYFRCVGGARAIGGSENIIAHLTSKYRLTIDAALNQQQRDTSHLLTRMLDNLYWVMSYSRWKDERFWPAFRDALRGKCSLLSPV